MTPAPRRSWRSWTTSAASTSTSPEPLNVAYAIGALAGLRTGEVFALQWPHVELAARRIHVRESVSGLLKDKGSRMVPILDALYPVLAQWKLRTGGEGRVIPSMRSEGVRISKRIPGKHLRATLKRLGLTRPGLGWYEATCHTFASQWVLEGGSIEVLKEILGHYSVVVTERYTHLRPDLFADRERSTIPLDAARLWREQKGSAWTSYKRLLASALDVLARSETVLGEVLEGEPPRQGGV